MHEVSCRKPQSKLYLSRPLLLGLTRLAVATLYWFIETPACGGVKIIIAYPTLRLKDDI